MTVQFKGYYRREHVAAMLEPVVRESLAPTRDPMEILGDIRDILAELDRMDAVRQAESQVSIERDARYQEAETRIRATIEPASGQCSYSTAHYSGQRQHCKHPAKARFGVLWCGLHLRSEVNEAVRKAKYQSDMAHREETLSEAELAIQADRDLRRSREF
jgi:hypothetical protein